MSEKQQMVKNIIVKYKAVLENLGIHVERIILYGSFAKGTPRKDSDIDLIVVSKDFKNLNLRERLEILGIASARIMKPIEAKGYTHEEITKISPYSFLNEALKFGLVV